MKRLLTFMLVTVMAIVVSVMPTPSLAGAGTFTVTNLGTLGSYSRAYAINNAGQVVGVSSTAGGGFHAFLWQNGSMADLGSLGAGSEARAIGALGQVAGFNYSAGGSSGYHAFLWQSGVMTDLGTLGTASSAYGVNSSSQVVGYSNTAGGGLRAFLWQNGVMTDLGTLGGSESRAYAINDAGQVVGGSFNAAGAYRAFLWQNGTWTDLGTLYGRSEALAINASGQVAGYFYAAGLNSHAILWQNGTMTDLGTLGGNTSSAFALNASGQVVGQSATSNGVDHAFLWQNGVMADLNSLIPLDSGWELLSAQGVNDAGQIVGYGLFNGLARAFLLTPPIPTDGQGPVSFDVVANPNPAVLGTAITLSATISDTLTGNSTIASAEYSINGGAYAPMSATDGSFNSPVENVSATIGAFSTSGVYNVCVRGSDSAGNTGQEACILLSAVPPDNQGPVSSNVVADPNPVAVGASVTLSAIVSDTLTGNSPVVSAEYSINAGAYAPMSATDGSFNSPVENVSATIGAFSTSGVYNVCVRGSDSAGNTGQEACILLVVYDLSAGYVRGVANIASPAGAYVANPSVTGKAHVAFVAKYQPGATLPEGNTKLRFRVADLDFQSISYESLVVTGAKAQLKGAGAINGTPGYSFILTAIDGDVVGGGAPDKLRIKIWNGGGLVYDNQIGSSDSDDPTAAILGGNIFVH